MAVTLTVVAYENMIVVKNLVAAVRCIDNIFTVADGSSGLGGAFNYDVLNLISVPGVGLFLCGNDSNVL